jgi:peroxiredoxin
LAASELGLVTDNLMMTLPMKRAITLSLIFGLAVAALAGLQAGQPAAQTASIVFPQLLSPADAILMTNASFRYFAGNKIFFSNESECQWFHAADLNSEVLTALHITTAQLEAQQKNLDTASQRYQAAAAAAREAAMAAPDFKATDIFGKTIRLSDYKGKVVVLESYTSGPGCPFCGMHYTSGAMQELQRELTNNGAVWLLVDFTPRVAGQTPAKAWQEWTAKKMAVTYYVIDTDGSQIGRRYGLRSTPEAVVIAQDGRLAYVGAFDDIGPLWRNSAEIQATIGGPDTAVGRMPLWELLAARDRAILDLDPRQTRNYVREAVSALLAGQPVAVSETKPYGCPLSRIYQ